MKPFTAKGNGTNVEPPSSPRHRKVLGRWEPGEPRRPFIEEAQEWRPTIEEFKDPLAYIEKIRPFVESYGICKIIPPSGWSPPCRLKEKSIWELIKFHTRTQNIELLQNRGPMKEKKPQPKTKKRKRGRNSRMAPSKRLFVSVPESVSTNETTEEEKFGFNTGSDFTLKEFEKYARNFRASYFQRKNRLRTRRAPSVEEIEGEYWRIVEEPTDDVEVYYGADLEDGVLGSGFYKGQEMLTGRTDMDQYITSGWNLNNISRLPGSLLSLEESVISGIVVPWLYVGMCFSSFCWHVEDHHLYSLNYHHFGEPKVWYGVAACHATNLEKAMRNYLPELFEEQPNLLHGLVTQFSPTILKEQGVPVYRLVQNPGEYIVTYPRAYHAGFSTGFNITEAVNVAPLEWLSHGQNAVELYSNESRKTTLSHDRLLLGAVCDALKSIGELIASGKEIGENLRWMKNGILIDALRTRLQIEEGRIEAIRSDFKLVEMDKNFDSNCERDCFSCLYDLHLSASGCYKCSPGKYACTKHAKDLCSCDGNDRFVLLRYTIDELSLLVKALELESVDLIDWGSKLIEERSASQKEESLLMRKESDFDLNLDYQLDDEVNTSMIDFAASVERLNLGLLVFGKLWSNKHAIFPKEFKSKVEFFNVEDPTRQSPYICEVIDAGLMGPLFRVTLEESEDVTFSNVSPQGCWEMVLNRLNKKISKRSQAEKFHTPETIDGLKMFGFLSPSIIQATEALDPNHRLVEYWNHKKEKASLEKDDSISNASPSSAN